MNYKIKLSKSSISDIEKKAVLEVLEKEFLGMGSKVQLFESQIKIYLNTDLEVACVNSGTAALHLSLSALNIHSGDEVLVPSLTYTASFQAISAVGAKPVACEVDEDTLFINVNDARNKITSKTKAIMPVHYASSSKGMKSVYSLANEFNIRVVEDAAQAFGSKRNGVKVGVLGDIVCFSFDGIKNLTSGEGGAILSSDKLFMQKVKDGRLLGIEKDTDKRFKGDRSWDFDVKDQGFRYHMSDIMAAIGIAQFERFDQFEQKRKKFAKPYLFQRRLLLKIYTINFKKEGED